MDELLGQLGLVRAGSVVLNRPRVVLVLLHWVAVVEHEKLQRLRQYESVEVVLDWPCFRQNVIRRGSVAKPVEEFT